MGTIMKLNDDTCAYYGFDTNVDANSIFKYQILSIYNVEYVSAGALSVCIKDKEGIYYFYGDNSLNPVLEKHKNEHGIFSDNPLIKRTVG